MTRRTLVIMCAAVAAAFLAPASAFAAQRMYIGFQDDPSLRWREDRASVFDQALQANADIIRTNVYWSRIAATRPALATNSFDPAYNFNDLDEFVRSAQIRGMEVILTIVSTPDWANGVQGQNHAPTNMIDLQDFAQALASRYSGAYPGLPFVRYFTVWNEPNLAQFLAPTFNAQGKPVSPYTYANMYRAAYTGIKAGNPAAKVGIGETSPRGRDKPTPQPGKLQDTISPGLFARLLSTVRPALRFDAWAQHPYSELGRGPYQRYRFPNVNLTTLPTFEKKLDQWFHRKNIPIWITEYGFETKPAEPKGVTLSQQATYMRQSIETVRKDPRVQAFIWFILRDDPTSTWQSGLISLDGVRKPAFATFAAEAKLVDAHSPIVKVRSGVPPVIRIPVLELAARNSAGAVIGATVRLYNKGKLAFVQQAPTTIGPDGWATFTLSKDASATRGTFSVTFDLNDKNGNTLKKTATLIVT
jgi:Cellulase (glycosyl hydrolase family 5)